MIKSEFTLRGELLTVPTSFDEPRLRAAAYAWLDMALELFAQEVFSALQMRWWRPLDGSAPVLLLDPAAPLLVDLSVRRRRGDQRSRRDGALTGDDDRAVPGAGERAVQVGQYLLRSTDRIGADGCQRIGDAQYRESHTALAISSSARARPASSPNRSPVIPQSNIY